MLLTHSVCVYEQWMAPEVVAGTQDYGDKADIYSLAVVGATNA